MAARIKKGDRVVILAGKDKGKTGDVLQVMPKQSRVIVSGANIVKRHTPPSQMNAGGIVEKEASVHVSNVAHAAGWVQDARGRPESTLRQTFRRSYRYVRQVSRSYG